MKFHQQLNDKFWDKDNDNQMRPEVLAKLKEIANAFIEYIEIPEDAVLDIVVTGSSASYNYNKYSDLDLHIIVDYDKIHEDCPLVEGYLGALKNTFNKEHDIFIKDVPVELYAEKKDQGTVHNGLYSLNTGWIDFPEKIEPTDNDAAVEAKYQEIKEMVDKCDDSESATELLEKIYNMRKAGLAESGEFCTENLAFKKLRNEGCMDKLRKLKKEQIDKQLSLESYNEDIQKLSRDDFKIIKTENGLYKVDGEYDSRIGYIAPNKNFRTVDNALGNAIYKYNTKFIQEDRKALISKLHKLFKQAGIPKMKDMTSSIRGYRPITQNGYYIDIYRGDRTCFHIGTTGSKEEWANKIKEILNNEGVKYTGSVDYFTVDMEKQDNKNESIKEELKEKEYQGCKYTILPDGKYCSIKIYAPKGYSFKNGDTWYSTETELKKADKKAKDIIDNEIELKESIKEEILPHNLPKLNKLIDRLNNSGYWKVDGDEIRVDHGFGTVTEQMDLSDLADEFRKIGFKVYVSHFSIEVKGLKDYMNKNESIKESSIIDNFKEMVNKIAKDFKAKGYPKSKKFLLDFVDEAIKEFETSNDNKIKVSTDNGTAVLTLDDMYQGRINSQTGKVRFTDLENSNYAYESLNNALQKSICEATECKDPYETEEEINGFKLCSFFGYHYANAVYVEEKETGKTVGWDQYENELYLEGPNMETKTYELVKQPELTANVEEVKNMLPSILANGNIQDFPVSQFLEKISQINKDILENYPIYWDKNHEGNREPIKNEDVATLTDKVDQANNDLQDIIKSLSNEALQEPVEIGTRVGTPDGEITGTVKEVNVADKTVKIDTDEIPGKGKEEKVFKIEELDNIIKEALEE